ncbi:type II toxin-antitoxin system Phd/YefM family antitoxin [Microbacterium sp. NEAU-LLC]|uniref:Antitoxin n=1 Tax=Microbacterium helvum TaxID=2773713 RepID=A0ABR8NHF1_9MICO|nr:type II toxin-antitoxin system Phd/YefM family antitoxin [Microbacterium helvum]MBD3940120.1 type II toxin-antitoxin system Phd/YefM family antitoxin [Microbacterium helvum]
MVTISASAARQTLPAQLDRVARGEEVAITRHGRVVAVLVSPDALRARRAPLAWQLADQLGARIEDARAEELLTVPIDSSRAESLVAGIRASRSGR